MIRDQDTRRGDGNIGLFERGNEVGIDFWHEAVGSLRYRHGRDEQKLKEDAWQLHDGLYLEASEQLLEE